MMTPARQTADRQNGAGGKPSAHTVIRGARLLDIDAHEAPHADILIAGDEIAEIGAPGLSAPDDAEVVDGAGLMMMPGLVNAHTHGHGSLAKGVGDLWTLELLLNAAPWIMGGKTLDHVVLATRLNAAEMIKSGCTTAYDLNVTFPVPTLEAMSAAAEGYAGAGMRAVLAPMMADKHFYEAIPGLIEAMPDKAQGRLREMRANPADRLLEACEDILKNWAYDRDRVRPALAPTIPLFCSEEFLAGCRDLAEEYDVGLHMHLSESSAQVEAGHRRYGTTLAEYLDSQKFLSPRFTGAHCVWLSDDDIARMADNGCAIAHNPGSNLRLGSGIARVREMLTANIPVGIGTDGSNCSDNQNMFEAARFAAYVSRVKTPEYTHWVSSADALKMATQGGARVLGMGDKIGQLSPGYKADIVFLNLSDVGFVPMNDPTNQTVYAQTGTGVRHVMVGAEMVLHDYAFTRFDYDKLVGDIEAAMASLEDATAQARDFADRLEPYVGRFCVGLAAQGR